MRDVYSVRISSTTFLDDGSKRTDWPRGSIDQQISDFHGACMDQAMRSVVARPGGSGSPRSSLSSRRNPAIAGGLLLIVIVWGLWPSPYSKVANLESHGLNIIALGDSLTAGYGAATGEDYPTQLSERTRVTGAQRRREWRHNRRGADPARQRCSLA